MCAATADAARAVVINLACKLTTKVSQFLPRCEQSGTLYTQFAALGHRTALALV
jgi:hypothetical protein